MPTVTPLNQKVNPDGTVEFDFEGHVHATGLDLDASSSTSPEADRRISWYRTSDGALLAYVAGAQAAFAEVRAISQENTTPAIAILRAVRGETDSPDWQSGISVGSRRAATGAVDLPLETDRVVAFAGDPLAGTLRERTILNHLGMSSFLQARGVWGAVTSAGGIANAGSGDWGVTRSAAGIYDIAFNPDFDVIGAVLPIADISGSTRTPHADTPTAAGCSVRFRDTAGTLADVAFRFLAVGVGYASIPDGITTDP